jgi:hypothetical protein
MASLESLKNPVTRLGVLGTAASQSASFRRNEVNNGDIWDVTKQYYLNDMVFSEIDGGAYVFSGGATAGGAPPQTSILGGVDPATDWFNGNSVWVPLATLGPRVVEPTGTQSATVSAPPAGAFAFVNCNLEQESVGDATNFPLGSANYMAHVQMTVTLSSVATAAEWFTLTFTPTLGTAAPAVSVTVVPAVGLAAQNVSVSAYVPLATDGTTESIVLTGAMNSASTVAVSSISNLNVSYIPVMP